MQDESIVPSRHVLTARAVEGLKPRAARYAVADSHVPGLMLRVQPSGGRTWALRYRVHGQQRLHTLGRYPGVSLADARDEARRLLRDVDLGADPRVEAQTAREADEEARTNTFGALVDAYGASLRQRGRRTWKELVRYLYVDVPSAWHARPAASITRREIRAVVQAKAAQRPVAGNRLLEAIRAAYYVGLDQELVEVNPAARLKKPISEHPRERVLSPEEVRAFWRACDELKVPMAALWRLRLVTLQRLGEIAGMRWAELDLDAKLWTIPGAKTKNGRPHLVPLNRQALDILGALPRRGRELEGYVLRGARGKRQQCEAARTFGLGDFVGHDLRRTATTHMRRHKIPRADVAAVLNHKPREGGPATKHYDLYDMLDEKQRALATWARVLRQMLEAKDIVESEAYAVALTVTDAAKVLAFGR